MTAEIIPKEPTLRHMKREMEKCELAAVAEPELHASKLREKAALLREWIAVLKMPGWN